MRQEQVTQANRDMHDILAGYYDAANLLMLEDGADSQFRIDDAIKRLARETSGGTLLDCGCGTGNILKFAETYFKRCIGFDVSYRMLSRNKGRKAVLAQGDVNFLPFRGGQIDAVTCFSVVHHMFEFDRFFREIARVLKPGGLLYTDNDPNAFAAGLHDLAQQSAFFRALMGVYFIPLRFSRSFRMRARLLNEFSAQLGEAELKKFDDISRQAEYHLSRGLDPYLIREKLEAAGFEDVRIFFHFRGRELRNEQTLAERLSLLVRMLCRPQFAFYRNGRRLGLGELAPYYAIIARRRKE